MDDRKYKVTSTSYVTADVQDIELSLSPNGQTRKIIRAQIVRNAKIKENTVEIALVHQRRHKNDDVWEDLGGKTLSEIKAGDAAKIQLDTKQTRSLFERLSDLYDIGDGGIPSGTVVLQVAKEDEVLKTTAGRARLIKKLLDADYGEEM